MVLVYLTYAEVQKLIKWCVCFLCWPVVLRYKTASGALQTELDLGRREAEGLRCELKAANDRWKEVVDGAGGAREAARSARYGNETTQSVGRAVVFFRRGCRRLFDGG